MGETIRFLLDGEVHEVRGANPTTTLLEHLRGPMRRTGTKEGCAEGDCGSCTVLVGEPDGEGPAGRVAWRAVNSCIQFLPMLHGKALMTVESLAKGGALHPVQQAMVDKHGSQCGFCTPGIVMSLYGRAIAAKGAAAPVGEVLAGNLCRCTGYGPIIEVAKGVAAEPAPAVDLSPLHDETMLDLSFEDPIHGVTRRWLAPRTVDELAQVYEAHPDATIVAGATDVGLWVTKQRRPLPILISVSEVAELKALEETAEALRIGAGVRYVDAVEAISKLYPDLGAMMRRLGSTQVRNSGTIGGNIANGSPIGDMPPALIAAGATLVLRKGSERREMPLEDFFLDYGKQDRRPGEFVEAVIAPKLDASRIFKVFKLSKRFDQDISAVCGAFSLAVKDGVVADVRIAFGGMAGTPKRAKACEAALVGQPWTEATVEAGMAGLDIDYKPMSDMRASAAYRSLTARNMLRKVFLESQDPDAETRIVPESAHG
ncbi:MULTISPECIES: xanthine dehydrogenase small subunit [unclassified Caulobacter]|uniref:xanthine dehydrogenase small subunit n=1 Tax=unclassified Caulobacter TaxID=2648921 RepID=UPI0006FC5155|nr:MULTISPECIES: xanthine dehydrogenase small subunit [unclassified Caulobacter]KQV56481.1 FAD-binding molybdopterin dehydrogenase [Caulobacter sp. Root342]KQV72116.1 FAD-binding molybdopterin dehydrogenase [Caulobacter sp. Root343]